MLSKIESEFQSIGTAECGGLNSMGSYAVAFVETGMNAPETTISEKTNIASQYLLRVRTHPAIFSGLTIASQGISLFWKLLLPARTTAQSFYLAPSFRCS